MSVGKRNRLVTIKSRTPGEDEAGQPLNTWTVDVCSVWANIKHLNGVETIKGGAEASTVNASIRIRYRTDLTTDMRVEHGSTVYQIKALLPDEVKREHVDIVAEVVT